MSGFSGEFFIIDSPLEEGEVMGGAVMLDSSLTVYGQTTYAVFDLRGKLLRQAAHTGPGQILSMKVGHFTKESKSLSKINTLPFPADA